MKKLVISGLVLALTSGCGLSFSTATRNVTAGNCTDEASMEAFVNNLPPDPFLNGAQKLAVQKQICQAMFGTKAAPPTAPGNKPAIP